MSFIRWILIIIAFVFVAFLSIGAVIINLFDRENENGRQVQTADKESRE